MKKAIMIFLFSFLFVTSCGREGQEVKESIKEEISDQEEREDKKKDTDICEKLEKINLDKSAVSVISYIEQEVDALIYFDDTRLVYFVDEQSKDSPDTVTEMIYLYNYETGENRCLLKVSDVHCSMGDVCLLGNKLYYSFGHLSGVLEYNSLLEIDLKTSSARVIPIEDATVPFVSLAATEQALFTLKRNEVSKDRSDYIVERVIGQEFFPVAQTSWENDKGGIIKCINGDGELLYVYGKRNSDEEGYIVCLTTDGEKKEQYPLDVTEFLKLDMRGIYGEEYGEELEEGGEEESDTIWSMVKRGNYYILHTINNRNLILKKEEGKLVSVSVPKQLNSPDLSYATNLVTDFEQGKYVFFLEIFENEFFILDSETGKFACCKIKVDGEIVKAFQHGENKFLFQVEREDGTMDYLLYEREEGWEI